MSDSDDDAPIKRHSMQISKRDDSSDDEVIVPRHQKVPRPAAKDTDSDSDMPIEPKKPMMIEIAPKQNDKLINAEKAVANQKITIEAEKNKVNGMEQALHRARETLRLAEHQLKTLEERLDSLKTTDAGDVSGDEAPMATSDLDPKLFEYTEEEFLSERGPALVGTIGTGEDHAVHMLRRAFRAKTGHQIPMYMRLHLSKSISNRLSSLSEGKEKQTLAVTLYLKPIHKTEVETALLGMQYTADAMAGFFNAVGGIEITSWDDGKIYFENRKMMKTPDKSKIGNTMHAYKTKKTKADPPDVKMNDHVLKQLINYAFERTGVDRSLTLYITYTNESMRGVSGWSFATDGRPHVTISKHFLRVNPLKNIVNTYTALLSYLALALRGTEVKSFAQAMDEAVRCGARNEHRIYW